MKKVSFTFLIGKHSPYKKVTKTLFTLRMITLPHRGHHDHVCFAVKT